MKKLLVICGPTSTGKTSLAVTLSKKFNGEIVSADSRQVYKGMDIGTGKDLPENAKCQMINDKWGYYGVDGTKVWGYDLVGPKGEFSVAHYVKFARKILNGIWERNKLPILVGGTGLYIKAVVDGIQTMNVSRNIGLRKSLKMREAGELFEFLAKLDPIKAASLNSSDKKNPRRLIRAIEIAQHRLDNPLHARDTDTKFDTLFIGLAAPKELLNERIGERVKRRLKMGMEKEVRRLIKSGLSWESQAMDSIGYKGWKEYFEGKKAKEHVIKEWGKEEQSYAKRQLTWFKKDTRINWFDISQVGWQKNVEFMVKKWYYQSVDYVS